MSIVDYPSLQASLASWLHRSDLTAQIPDFVMLAEMKLNGDLDARAMDTVVTLPTVAGTSYATLPTDMMEMRRLVNPGCAPLEYVSPDQFSVEYGDCWLRTPRLFTVIGGRIQFAPTPDAVYLLELTYKQRIPPLSTTNPTNWLITSYPNAYLWGALVSAQPWLASDDRLGTFQALYKEAVAQINKIDWCSGTTLVMRTDRRG
ncbi:hypothetical protein PQR01_00400 [Paraburkholderia rhynchosiae]|uniref:Uncharacterized protein n=1 Tax=Paraburkholderia rhynchosiae TaxID=487049 RepID=A0ACC7N4W6_9BURK